MKIERQTVGTVEVLEPAGALVDQDAEAFASVLRESVAGANARLVVAMAEVPYMDSQAIEGLLDASDELGARTAGLKLVGVTSSCREILDLTGVSHRFSFFENVQDAVRSFL